VGGWPQDVSRIVAFDANQRATSGGRVETIFRRSGRLHRSPAWAITSTTDSRAPRRSPATFCGHSQPRPWTDSGRPRAAASRRRVGIGCAFAYTHHGSGVWLGDPVSAHADQRRPAPSSALNDRAVAFAEFAIRGYRSGRRVLLRRSRRTVSAERQLDVFWSAGYCATFHLPQGAACQTMSDPAAASWDVGGGSLPGRRRRTAAF
jgi:hypothetical protein